MPKRLAYSILVAAIVAAIVAACGNDAGDSPGVDATTALPAADTTPTATSAAHGGDHGSGTLRLGDEVYEFAVVACDFDGDADDMYQTVSGRGTTSDGENFDLFVSRNDPGGMLTHTVSLQIGDVRTGGGTVWEAQRMRHGSQWMSTFGGAEEPLIRIDGNRLTASGTFGDPTGAATRTRQGTLEATCR